MSKRSGGRKAKQYVYETLPAPGAPRASRVWGYARVSTADVVKDDSGNVVLNPNGTVKKSQTTEMQVEALKAAGCEQIVTDEGVSGSTEGATRPGLSKLLGTVADGDTLVVWKLDRLGRSVIDLCDLVEGLKQKGVAFRSLTEGFDTSTPAGTFMFHMLGAIAQFERAMIRERVLAGVKNAQANGVHCGRQPKLSAIQMDTVRDMVKQGKSLLTIAATFHVSKRTISRALSGGASASGGKL